VLVLGVDAWDDERAGAVLAARHWLPNHLDALAVGLALAVLVAWRREGGAADGIADRLGALADRPATAWAAPAAALATVVVVAAIVGRTAAEGAGHTDELVLHLGGVIVAALLVGPVVLGRGEAAGSPLRRLLDARAVAVVGPLAYGLLVWHPIVLDRWVSPAVAGGVPAPARHAGELFRVAFLPTLAFLLVGTVAVAVVARLAVQRPVARYLDRPIGGFRGGLWAIVGASFLTRIWGLGAVTDNNPGNGDPFFYHAQANMLADGVGFGEPIQWLTEHRFVASAIHPPIYTLWFTPSSLLGSRGFLAHKAMGAIAGLLVVVVIGLLVRRLAGDRAGLLAAGLAALYPNLWIIDGTLWPEGLYTATIGFALLMAYRWRDDPKPATAAALGAACGVAILTRGEALLLLPMLCLPLAFLARRQVADWFRHLVIMGVAAGVLLAPWMVRNLVTYDRVVLVSTNSDEVLYYANCPDAYHGRFIGYWSFACQEREREARLARGLPADPPGNEAERAAAWGKMGRQYALDHKDRLPAVAAARVARAWDLRYAENNVMALVLEGRPEAWGRAGLWVYRVTVLPGLVGLVLLRRRGRQVWPLVMMLAMVTVTAVYAYGHVRFRTAGDLVLLMGAAVTVDTLLPRRRNETA